MNKTALEDLHFDTVVTAEYKLKMSAAASGSERGDRPVILPRAASTTARQ